MNRSSDVASLDAPFEPLERRAEHRKAVAIHAFASDTNSKYDVKCVIRDVSPSGCKIVSNGMEDLPDIIYLLPEGFEKPILARIVWRQKNIGGVRFLSDNKEEECLLINPLDGLDDRQHSSEIGKATLQSCSRTNGFRDRFQFFAARRNRKAHDAKAPANDKRRSAVGDFVSMIVHELRTPLTSILGSLGLMKSGAGAGSPGNTSSLVNIAHRNAQKLSAMVNDLLHLGKAESGKMEFEFRSVDVVALARESVDLNEPYAAKYGVHFCVEDKVGRAHVRADATRLEQVLTNLLSNAAKFSPEGQAVDVIVERRGAHIRVAVRDRGLGIAQEKQDQVFQKFVQVGSHDGREKHGTGLGLSICKSIVEQHGGSLQIESELGSGSTFFFELPEIDAGGNANEGLAAE